MDKNVRQQMIASVIAVLMENALPKLLVFIL